MRSYLIAALGVVFLMTASLTASPEPERTTESAAILKLIVYRNPGINPANAQLITDSIILSGQQASVDTKIIAAIISVESRFNHRAAHGGAEGLGQLTRGTARSMGIQDPFSITQNVTGTTKYFKTLMDTWAKHPQQRDMALASYLTGPRRASLSGRSRRYINAVQVHYDRIVAYQREIPARTQN
jgi:soluble lytic murein transglycosylase-like protein